MSYNKIQELAEKFANKTVFLGDDEAFNKQRLQMKEFYVSFYRSLRGLLGSLEGEIKVLKERDFDSGMMKLLIKCYRDLLELAKSSDPEHPYVMGEKFVHYILSRPNIDIINNLDFLIQHQLKTTNIKTQVGSLLGSPTAIALVGLKHLAKQVQSFMAANPSIPIPGSSPPPSNLLSVTPEEEPAVLDPMESTNPASPLSKKNY